MKKILYVTASSIVLIAFLIIRILTINNNSDTSNNSTPTSTVQTSASTTRQTEETTTVASTTTTTTTTTTTQTTQRTSGEYEIPSGASSFKSYTHYKMLSKQSPQWKKIQCHSNAYTDERGLRKVDEYYCVAMASYYTKKLGDLFEITTEGGSFNVIICDFKSDRSADENNQYTLSDGSIVEFYIDIDVFDKTAKRLGDVSYVYEKFRGKIISIKKLGNYFETKEE